MRSMFQKDDPEMYWNCVKKLSEVTEKKIPGNFSTLLNVIS